MHIPSAVTVQIDLQRIRANAAEIRRRCGVAVYAVLKADAYGLGAEPVAQAIADAVDGWCVFSLSEAVAAQLWERTQKETIVLGPPQSLDPADYRWRHVRPAVSTVEQAKALALADPILCVDTGMQRFACPPEAIEAVLQAGHCREAFTHATRLEHVRRLVERVGGRGLRLHAAPSGLLDEPEATLDAVRPGLALYRDAIHVSTPLVEVRDTTGPVGYTQFAARRIGVILCGYAQGLRKGPCLVNGQRRMIREVGMQTAYVELEAGDKPGNEAILLGKGLSPENVAAAWGSTPHETVVALARSGPRKYTRP